MQGFSSHVQKRCQKSGREKKKKVKPRKDFYTHKELILTFALGEKKTLPRDPIGFHLLQHWNEDIS